MNSQKLRTYLNRQCRLCLSTSLENNCSKCWSEVFVMFNIDVKKLYQRLIRPIYYASPFPVIVLNSWISLWWVIVLVFEQYDESIPFNQLLVAHAPHEFWIAAFFSIAVGLFVGRFLGSTTIQRVFMLMAVGLWTFITALLCKVNPLFYATGYYGTMALISGWAFWRIRYGVYRRLDTPDS